MRDKFLDIHGHQIEPGHLVKTSNDNTYLAMINPDTWHLEFQRLNKPPDAEVLWWFYDELQKPEIIGRWEEEWTKSIRRAMAAEARVEKLLNGPDGLREFINANNVLRDELKAAEAKIKELKEEIEALKWQLKEQDNAALRTLEIERDEKRIWKKRAKRR